MPDTDDSIERAAPLSIVAGSASPDAASSALADLLARVEAAEARAADAEKAAADLAAAHAAQTPAEPAPEPDYTGLVWMTRGSEVLPIHPTCVAEHKSLGFVPA